MTRTHHGRILVGLDFGLNDFKSLSLKIHCLRTRVSEVRILPDAPLKPLEILNNYRFAPWSTPMPQSAFKCISRHHHAWPTGRISGRIFNSILSRFHIEYRRLAILKFYLTTSLISKLFKAASGLGGSHAI
jgi:hypothetical protein